jgi:photosystem II stability/assembly factor-like uncharacterized protein
MKLIKVIKVFFLAAGLSLTFVLALGAKPVPVAVIRCNWEPVGPGGGGGMFFPTFSPHNRGRLMTLGCDMGGSYRSIDHGKTWEMMDYGLQGRPGGPISYDPVNPNTLFSVKYRKIWKSSDAGRSWKAVANIKAIGNGAIVIDPTNHKQMWAGMTKEAVTPLYASNDGGNTWKESSQGIPDRTEVRDLLLDSAAPPGKRRLFAATNNGFFISWDNGHTWIRGNGLPGDDLLSMAGYSSAKTNCVLYVAVKGKGVYRSINSGREWEPVNIGLSSGGTTCRLLAMSRTGDKSVYSVCGVGEIYRTDNGGKSWQLMHNAIKDKMEGCWISKELGPGWAGHVLGLAVNPNDSSELMFTDYMRACVSRDGGRTWRALHTRQSANGWGTTGLGVTNAYKYSFDPKDPKLQYITNTDIGLFKSIDNGISWKQVVKGAPRSKNWSNTCYEIAADPADPNKIWGAFSRLHDLPLAYGANHGGICFSIDGAENWKACTGLPDAAGTTIVVDARSAPASRTLYAGLYKAGVFKSVDGGKTWVEKCRGLPPKAPVWRLVQQSDGTLICVLSRFRDSPGGLFVSRDGAENWSKLENGLLFNFPLDVAVDPRSAQSMYVASFSIKINGRPSPGGLYKSTDGGKNWRCLLNDSQIWGVSLDPRNPEIVYACCMSTGSGPTHGVLRSSDGGRNWKQLIGIPFYNIHSVTVDPRDSRIIYVTTFGGGVWKTKLPYV